MSEPKPDPSASSTAASQSDDGRTQADPAASVIEDLESLRTRATERDQFLSLLKRTQADFENYQKRNQREREQERRYAAATMAIDLLPVLDNLERATAAAQQAGETGPLVQGVSMVHGQLIDLLRRHGITPIDALGQSFDPNLHSAVMQKPSSDVAPNTVVQVLEQGFMHHDRVLRPSRVVVSASGT
jgi:molecular chaperone GrpE